MIDLALDPSETRSAPDAVRHRAVRRPWGRIALFSALGVAGTGAFAGAANTYLSGVARPQRAPLIVVSQKAAEWPDLKDGLPALATGSVPAIPKVREILPPEPATPSVVEARIEPFLRAGSAMAVGAAAPPAATGRTADAAPTTVSTPVAALAAKPPLAIVNVPVIGPARQAALVAPSRTVTALAPLAVETVRARTENATYAALPPEHHGGVRNNPASARDETIQSEMSRPEPSKAKPRIEARSKPPVGVKSPDAKMAAEKPVARKAAAVEANAAPLEARAQDEDTEVFGIKVPSLAPAGRKLRESVEALGDAVKGIPERF